MGAKSENKTTSSPKAISTKLSVLFVPMLVVPGNHDMKLPDGCRGAEDIIGWNVEDHVVEETDRL